MKTERHKTEDTINTKNLTWITKNVNSNHKSQT